jgi:hypothetical protein
MSFKDLYKVSGGLGQKKGVAFGNTYILLKGF